MTSKLICMDSIEFKAALDSVVDCYERVLAKYKDDDKTEIIINLNSILLMVPCLSMRPDSIKLINDQIFSSSVFTHFIFDLSFRFFSMTGNCDSFISKLANNLIRGLTIDGPDIEKNIIPPQIAASCPVNLFTDSAASLFSMGNKGVSIETFLINNKHFILLYLLYLTND